ncbi:MAG: fluoride efflux transporter CrcB [Euzebyales bacterium]|nr:fluoride efflux transporter CrcB [Euzebyales bacterium]
MARYVLDYAIATRAPGPLPLGTFMVNVSGSLALGVVTGVAGSHGLEPALQTALTTGLLGGYTTFSTFAYETVRLLEEGARGAAALNALASLAAGTGAAALGLLLASW